MARAKRTDSKGRVLRVGESQDKSGRYCYKWTQDGKRQAVYGLTLQQLRDKEKEIQKRIDKGLDTSNRSKTLNELFDLYMETKDDIRATTKSNYIGVWNFNIRESFGKRKAADVEPMDIRRLYSDMQNSEDHQLSLATVKVIHGLLTAVFRLAIELHIRENNPTEKCIPRRDKKKDKGLRVALKQDQQDKFLDFVKNSPVYNQWYPMILFDLCTGLRFGELSGLRWSDIDADGVHVRQQLIYKNVGEGCRFYLTDLKTDAAERTVPLTITARRSLIQQKEFDLLLGKGGKRQEVGGVNDFCFVNRNGQPHAPNSFNNVLKNIINAYNKKETVKAKEENREPVLLPHISAHILRHTFATRMVEAGLEPKELQTIMGHTSITVTMDIYTDLDQNYIRESVEAIQKNIKIG